MQDVKVEHKSYGLMGLTFDLCPGITSRRDKLALEVMIREHSGVLLHITNPSSNATIPTGLRILVDLPERPFPHTHPVPAAFTQAKNAIDWTSIDPVVEKFALYQTGRQNVVIIRKEWLKTWVEQNEDGSIDAIWLYEEFSVKRQRAKPEYPGPRAIPKPVPIIDLTLDEPDLAPAWERLDADEGRGGSIVNAKSNPASIYNIHSQSTSLSTTDTLAQTKFTPSPVVKRIRLVVNENPTKSKRPKELPDGPFASSMAFVNGSTDRKAWLTSQINNFPELLRENTRRAGRSTLEARLLHNDIYSQYSWTRFYERNERDVMEALARLKNQGK